MKIEYKKEGEYLIPKMEIPNQPEEEVGAWGKMRQDFLKKHKQDEFTLMLVSGTLKPHLVEVEAAAVQRMDRLMEQIMKAEGVSEQLKAEDPIQWAKKAASVQARARETVMEELIRA